MSEYLTLKQDYSLNLIPGQLEFQCLTAQSYSDFPALAHAANVDGESYAWTAEKAAEFNEENTCGPESNECYFSVLSCWKTTVVNVPDSNDQEFTAYQEAQTNS